MTKTHTTHTPGPWVHSYEPDINGWHDIMAPVKGETTLQRVASVRKFVDAQLVASVPDMLKALRHAKEAIEYANRTFDVDISVEPVIKAIRMAENGN